jgi:drug/metabolite transporter (DMT)-like permease
VSETLSPCSRRLYPLMALFALIGVLNSGLSRLLLYVAIRHIGANQAESVHGTTPLFTFALAPLLLHEEPNWQQILGATLIIVGCLLVEAKLSSHNRAGDPRLGVGSALLSAFVFAVVLVLIKADLSSGYPFLEATLVVAVSSLAFNALMYDVRRLR